MHKYFEDVTGLDIVLLGICVERYEQALATALFSAFLQLLRGWRLGPQADLVLGGSTPRITKLLECLSSSGITCLESCIIVTA